jgi:hypothetical protein
MTDARRRRRRRRPRAAEDDTAGQPDGATAVEPGAATEDPSEEHTGGSARSEGKDGKDGSTLPVRVRRVSPEERERRAAAKRQRQRESDERPSRMRLVLLVLLGLLAGRILENNFDPNSTLMTAVDIVTYGGIAFSVAFLWRRWARRTLERRREEQQRMRRRREG